MISIRSLVSTTAHRNLTRWGVGGGCGYISIGRDLHSRAQTSINISLSMSSDELVAPSAPVVEWNPPKYHLQQQPRIAYSSNLSELEKDSEFGNFFRSAKWLASTTLFN